MRTIIALVLVVALVGFIATGIVDCKKDDNNGANPSLAPGQTGANPGQSGAAPPGQSSANPGQEMKNPPPADLINFFGSSMYRYRNTYSASSYPQQNIICEYHKNVVIPSINSAACSRFGFSVRVISPPLNGFSVFALILKNNTLHTRIVSNLPRPKRAAPFPGGVSYVLSPNGKSVAFSGARDKVTEWARVAPDRPGIGGDIGGSQ